MFFWDCKKVIFVSALKSPPARQHVNAVVIQPDVSKVGDEVKEEEKDHIHVG